MKIGFIYVLAATALWGFSFLSPKILPGFDGLEIVLGRYIVFGLFSLVLFARTRIWKKITFPNFKKSFSLALTSNILFYSFLVLSLQLAGGTLGSLLIGILPVTLALYGNYITKEFSYKIVLYPIAIIILGLAFLNIDEFILDLHGAPSTEGVKKAWGVVFGCLALICWTWYGVHNAQYLKKNPQIKGSDWATLLGISTFICALLVVFFLCIFQPTPFKIVSLPLFSPESNIFIITSLVLGILVTWVPTLLWNKASSYLPVPLLGQLIVFEPMFALIYNYAFDLRMPTFFESLGVICIFSGVAWGIRKTRQAQKLKGMA